MKGCDIYIHIGFVKTGTTFLQKNFFERSNKVIYFSGEGFWNHDLSNQTEADKLLISFEVISGNPVSRDRVVGRKSYNWNNDFDTRIANLKRLFPDAKIIVGVREHQSFVLSLYKQYLHKGGTLSLKEFFSMKSTGLLSREELLYKPKFEALQSHFRDIFVYDQRMLFKDCSGVLARLGDFMGVDFVSSLTGNTLTYENQGVKLVPGNILRYLNKLNYFLRAVPFLPTLNNGLFKKLRITPRELCQVRLNPAFKKDFSLDFAENEMKTFYREDWNYVKTFIDNPSAA